MSRSATGCERRRAPARQIAMTMPATIAATTSTIRMLMRMLRPRCSSSVSIGVIGRGPAAATSAARSAWTTGVVAAGSAGGVGQRVRNRLGFDRLGFDKRRRSRRRRPRWRWSDAKRRWWRGRCRRRRGSGWSRWHGRGGRRSERDCRASARRIGGNEGDRLACRLRSRGLVSGLVVFAHLGCFTVGQGRSPGQVSGSPSKSSALSWFTMST